MIDFRNMDCMELMKEFPDNHFDLSIVDPPYGIGAGGTKFKNGSSKSEKPYFKENDWDTKRPSEQYFKELRRVSKNQIIWGGNYFSDMLPPFRCFVFWDKTIHGNSYADGELAWTSFDKVSRYFRMNIAQVTSDGRIHPTQKPVRLYTWLLTNYAKAGDKILDTHVGSASSLIACHQLGFDVVGCELDEEYYQLASQRLADEMAQMSLFNQ